MKYPSITDANRQADTIRTKYPCPICGYNCGFALYRASVPLFVNMSKKIHTGKGKSAILELVSCAKCGHSYNHLFEDFLAEEIYRLQNLTNVPVAPSMHARYKDLVDWLGEDIIIGKDVIEIGAGAGALARLIAKTARSVILFEPSLALRPEMLPEDNIELINEYWTSAGSGEKADFIICRQMLEHLINPVEVMADIRSGLNDGGLAYLEVPSAEYIYDFLAFPDIHIQHVQYFTQAHFIAAAASVGLIEERVLNIKDGHDFGVLFRAVAPLPFDVKMASAPIEFHRQVVAKRQAAELTLSNAPSPIIFFGATLHTQTFLNALTIPSDIQVIVDDNPENCGHVLSFGSEAIDIIVPTQETLSQAGCIVIGAYLHDFSIAEKVREAGFTGPLYTIRPHPLAASDCNLLSVYYN